MTNKDPKDMTPEELKEIKVEFAPGCFDNFDGTQEELDQMIAEIQRMVATGELFEKATPVDIDNMDDDEAYGLARALGIDPVTGEDLSTKRKLQ